MKGVSRKDLAEIIGARTLHISDKEQLVQSVASYLAGEHKAVDLSSLMRDVMLYRQREGMIEAVAISAHPLPAEVISDIKALLKDHFTNAKTILVDQRIDPELVGGIRIETAQEALDLSVKSKLNLFKRLVAEEGVR